MGNAIRFGGEQDAARHLRREVCGETKLMCETFA